MLVPTMLTAVANHSETKDYNLQSLKRIVYGASPIAETVLITLLKLLPTCGFMQAYGMTECSPVVTVLEPRQHYEGSSKLKSAGVPSPHVEARIVDTSNQELPRGTVGEIVRLEINYAPFYP